MGLSEEQRQDWERDGFFFARGFTPPDTCRRMLARAVELRGGRLVATAGA